MKKVLALGADNKTTYSIMSDKGLYVSDALGDLTYIEDYKNFERAIRSSITESETRPEVLACDMHPDYRSTRLADTIHGESPDSSLVKVQHHHAHITACMLDNDLNEEVIGVSFDGTGYGTDGASWGGEFLVSTRSSFKRVLHLEYVPQPGGDAAVKEPWRMALSYIHKACSGDILSSKSPLLKRVGEDKVFAVKQMIEKGINCPPTSSMGRLFDGVSSLLGICDTSGYEAEAAILLEKAAKKTERRAYSFDIKNGEVMVTPFIRAILEDVNKGVSSGVIAAKFHNTIGEMVLHVSRIISGMTGVNKVLISGGCFQNRYLTDYLEKRFEASELNLYRHKDFPTTDLGISIGQAVVASTM